MCYHKVILLFSALVKEQPYDEVDKVESTDDVTNNGTHDSFYYGVERKRPPRAFHDEKSEDV